MFVSLQITVFQLIFILLFIILGIRFESNSISIFMRLRESSRDGDDIKPRIVVFTSPTSIVRKGF